MSMYVVIIKFCDHAKILTDLNSESVATWPRFYGLEKCMCEIKLDLNIVSLITLKLCTGY